MSTHRVQCLIVAKSAALLGLHAGATGAVYVLLQTGGFKKGALTLAIALTLVLAVFALTLALALTIMRAAGQIRDRRFSVVAPRIRALFSEYGSGKVSPVQFGELVAKYPREFDRVFEEVISTVRGPSRKSIGRTAEELGLDRRWINASRCRSMQKRLRLLAALGVVGNAAAIDVLIRALQDPSDVVRLEAGLALARVGGANETKAVFELALSQNKLVQILLLEALRWRTHVLCDSIREHLRSGNPRVMTICLETVEAWRVVLDLPEIAFALRHPSSLVRERAFRALPYVMGVPDVDAAVIEGLTDAEDDVRTAAAYAAGRVKVRSAVCLLEKSLTASSGRLALTCAYALAEIGEEGVDVLERTAVSGKPAGTAALEALERLRVGRFEHASL